MPLSLTELFPDTDYRFHLTLRRGELAPFFTAEDPAALAERRRWLNDDPSRYAIGTADAEPMIAEFEEFARHWKPSIAPAPPSSPPADIPARLSALGKALEPDFLLLSKDEEGAFRLRAGVVCFPSSWVLAEKMGRTLEEIHTVVPGLNDTMAPPINQFLGKMKPGMAYERANWGLAATPELNMHPALQRPRLTLPLDKDRIWVRIEDQILATLPRTGGILFGIGLRVMPLRALLDDAMLSKGFLRALTSMPEPLAAYKGIATIRGALIAENSRL